GRGACRNGHARRVAGRNRRDFPFHPSAGAGDAGVSSILLVEDDAALRKSIHEILDRGGYEVRTASDGSAGVRELQSESFNVVLIAIGLGYRDGWRILVSLEGK